MRSKQKQQAAMARFKARNPGYFRAYYHANHIARREQANHRYGWNIEPDQVFALLCTWQIVGNLDRLTKSGRRIVIAATSAAE